jgi:hypothetical protein
MQASVLSLLLGAKAVENVRTTLADHRRELEGELAMARTDAQDLDPQSLLRERELTIDRLERRVAKLIAALEEAEGAVKNALASSAIDDGIASLYRVVQGLSPEDPKRANKRALMQTIFRANVELRQALAVTP